MDESDPCNVCDGTSFTLNAGFYYCDICGTQAAQKQEVEDHGAEFAGIEDPQRQLKHRIKDTSKREAIELTSWEAYNYILYGFVNELINLGCKEEIMLTTLQLWAAFLRRNEIAFFGKEETVLPRFNFHYKYRDVRIIYNIPMKKRRRSASSTSSLNSSAPTSLRQKKLAYTRKKKSLASIEYEEYKSSQKSDLSSISMNLSQRSSTLPPSEYSDGDIGFKYSQRAKQKARAVMTREHLLEHENDILNKLKCHKRLNETDTIGRPFVFALLWLALNQSDDDLQLSDLIRYTKEAHIKFNDISGFLPENVKSEHAVNSFRKAADEYQSHLALRVKALAIARTIGIRQLNLPNMSKLCRRYVEELALPPIIGDFIEKLLAFYPPQMKLQFCNNQSMAVPNFEGRAMAYVMFILKLFFGLDNDREYRISESAKKINARLMELDERQKHLFVWSDWKRFIEMRSIIVAQCHYPTAMHIDPNSEKRPDLFIDFMKKSAEGSTVQDKYRKGQMDNIRVIFEQVLRLHEPVTEQKPSIVFPATFTPFHTYMTYIEANQPLRSIINIPDYMSVRHENTDFLSYLQPKSMRNYFRHNNINLNVVKLSTRSDIDFSDVSFIDKKRTALNVQFEFDISEPDWQNLLHKNADAKKKQDVDSQFEQDGKIRQDIEQHLRNLRTKEENVQRERKEERNKTPLRPIIQQFTPVTPSQNVRIGSNPDDSISDILSMHTYQYFDELGQDINFDDILTEPRRNLDEQENILNYTEDDDGFTSEMETDLENAENIPFALTNYDYWMCLENIYFQTNQTFTKKMKNLPHNFQWLLKHCAMELHMHPKDLYIELLAIETQFRYVLKPIFKMNNRILYRNTTKDKTSARTFNAINLLKKIW